MTLQDYLSKHDLSIADLARRLDWPHETVRRYVTGERTPRGERMTALCDATDGEVTPASFFSEATA